MEKKRVEVGQILAFLAIVVVSMFMFVTMGYVDNPINSAAGYGIVDRLMKGTFLEYFHALDWPYGMTIYLIYAIWSIPVWIIFQIFQLPGSINDYLGVLLWYKLLLVVFAVWSTYLVARITQLVAGARKRDVALQYMSSCVFVFVIYAIAQCDIMGLCFVLLGVYYCIQDKRIKYISCFALAITMKYFAVLVFIPLVLYKERRILKILVSMAGGLSLTVLMKFILSFSQKASVQSTNEEFFVNKFVKEFDGFVLKIGQNIGLFAAMFMVVCVIAYMTKNKDRELRNKRIIWICLAGYMCFGMFFKMNPYWSILMVPFFIVLMYCNRRNLKINIVLEIAFFTCFIIASAYTDKFIFMGYHAYSFLVFKDCINFSSENLLVYFLNHLAGIDLENIIRHVYGIQYASGVIYLIINFPRNSDDMIEPDEGEEQDIKILQWLKIAILYALVIMSFIGWKHGCDESLYKGEAEVTFAENTYEAEHCVLVGDLQYLGEDVWMSESVEVEIYAEEVEGDIVVSTYGYTVDGRTDVEVYVNNQYVGTLEKEEAEANTTVRYLQIPKKYFDGDEVQKIRFEAVPQPIEYHNEEYMLSLYMTNIELKTVAK